MHETAAASENPRLSFRDAVVPFLTSLCVHATIVLVGVLMFRTLAAPRPQPAFEDQAVTPDGMVLDALSGPAVNATRTPLARPEFDDSSDESRDRLEKSVRESARADQFHVEEPRPDVSSVIGGPRLTSEREEGTKHSLLPFGPPNTNGVGRGPANIFGPGGGGGGRGGTGGGGGMIRSVVYVCDASGSMIDKFAALREQLRRSVGSLKPIQSFNVIFFRDERAAALSAGELLLAAPANQRKFEQFIDDINPSGQTDPIPALEIAFRQKPDLVWLLTDGDFPNNQAVIDFIRKRNKDARVRVNTIAFVDRGESYEKVLQTIATENRGSFKRVGEEELE